MVYSFIIVGANPKGWFRLFPKKHYSNEWWFHKNLNNTDSILTLHYKDRHSFRNQGIVVQNRACWSDLFQMLKGSNNNYDFVRVDRFFSRTLDKNLAGATISMTKVIGYLSVI